MIASGPHRLRLLLASCTALTALASMQAHANPEGGTVVAGQASISTPAPGHLVVQQGSARAVIDWRSFSIAPGEHTQFVQPSASAVALNRVTGPDPSVIAGRLSANGRIVLQNEAGITFSEGAQVSAASLLATTSRIDAQRLMATGEVAASAPGRVAGARVENRGEITVADSGVAALVGPEVRNAGRIVARQGRVVLGGAETYTIDLAGDGLVAFEVRDPVSRAPADGGAVVSNTGTLEAPGGQVVVSARAARGVVDEVIFAGGRIAATAVRQEGGTIVLGGGEAGTVTVAGNLDVSGQGAGQRGGTVDVRGERIALRAGARIDASGPSGGGTVRVGGDLRGQGPGQKAREVTVERSATILADATTAGDGGRVIVWSEEATRFWGEISARGGPQGGDGGFAEVSSKGWLDYRGLADLRATLGQVGVLLLDPRDLRIAASGDESVAVSGAPPEPIVITPDEPATPDAVSILRTATLETQLGLSDVVVTTVGSPDVAGQTGRIDIADGFVIPDGRTLTLEAAGEIAQAAAAAITTSGSADLVMQSGREGAGGISLAGTIALGAAGRLLLDATGGGTGAGGAISQSAGSITAADLLAQAAGAVSLTSAAVGTVAGSAGGAFSLAGTGALTVGTVAGVTGITAADQPITLGAAGALTLAGAVDAGTGSVSLTAGTDAVLTVDAALTAGAVTAVADRIAVNAALGAGAATVDIATRTGTRPILLGTGAELATPGADAAALAVNRDEFGRIGAPDATVRLRTVSGTITVSGTPGDPATGIALGGRSLMLETGSASASAITQTGPVTGGAGSALAASAASGSVTLTDPANSVGTIAGRAGGAGHVFRFANAGALTVGAVGGGALAEVAGILGAGGTVSLATSGAGAITQTGSGAIAAARLELDAAGAVDLDEATNQVGILAARSVGGLAFRSGQDLTVAAANTGPGDITITAVGATSDLAVAPDGLFLLAGVSNAAGAVALEAGGTLTVGAPVSAGTHVTLAGAQVAVNDAVEAPSVTVAADDLALGAGGALGTATLAEAVLRTRTAGRAISLGAAAAGALSIDAAELGRIGIGAGSYHLRIGSLGGADRPGEAATGTLTIRAGTDLSGRRLTLEAGSAGANVSQLAGAALAADSLIARSAAGSVLLGLAENNVGALAGGALGGMSDFEFLGLGDVTLGSLGHGTDAAVAGITAGRTVRLRTIFGTVQQTTAAPVTAENLLARSDFGGVDLTASAANSIGTLAGDAFAGFRVRAAGDLSVGAIGSSAAFPGVTSGITVTSAGAPVTLMAGGDLALAAPVDAAGGTVRLQAGQDLTQTAAGVVTADALLARAGRDLLLDGADGTALPGAPGGAGGNQVGTLAAVAGRELWYRSAQTFTVGMVAGTSGVTGGPDATVRLAVTGPGERITVAAPVAGQAIELAADALSLGATVGAGAEAVVVRPFTAGRGIELGNLFPFDPGTLWLSAEAIDLLGGAATTLRVGAVGGADEAAAGAIVVREHLFLFGTGIRVNRAGAPGDARTLVLESGTGSITQTGPITGGATATLVAVAPSGEVRLDHFGNAVGTIAGSAGAGGFRYRSGGAFAVGATTTLDIGGTVPLEILGRDGITTPSAPITLLAGGDLTLDRPLDAGSGTLRLEAGGTLGQGAASALTAGALLARGGAVELTGTQNQVGLLAGSSVSGFRFRHQGALTVGSVGDDAVLPVAGATGLRSVSGNAPITLRVEDGDLTLANALDAGSDVFSLVRLETDGTLSQGPDGFVIGNRLLARGASVLLDGINLVDAVAGEAQSQFRFSNFADLTVGEVAADGTLVDGQAGVRLASGGGTVTLRGGTGFFGGGVLLDRPVDAGTGSLALVAGAFGGNVQQTATGGITAGSLSVTASAGGVELASAGAANTVSTLTGTGRDGFRFRTAGALTVGAVGIATTDAPLTLVSGGDLTLAGSLDAGTDAVRLRAETGDIVQSGGAITAAELAVRADAGAIDLGLAGNAVGTFAGAAQGALVFRTGGGLTVGAIGPDGLLVPGLAGASSAAGAVTIEAGGSLTIAQAVEAGGNATLTAGAALTIDAGEAVRAGGAAVLAAAADLTVAGSVEAGTGATLTAGQSLSVSGTVEAGGTAALTAGQGLTLTGAVLAGAATLEAGTSLMLPGLVQTVGDAALSADAGGIVVMGAVQAGGAATLDTPGAILVTGGGDIDAGGNATLTADATITIDAGEAVRAGGAAVLDAATDLTVAGSVEAGTGATLTAGQSLSVSGTVEAGGTAALTAGQGLTLTGAVLAGAATLEAGTSLMLPGLVQTVGDAALAAGGGLVVAGLVDAGMSASLAAAEGLTVAGTVAAGTGATLTAGQSLSVSGTVAAGGTATLDAGQALTVTGSVRGTAAALAAGTSLDHDGLVQTSGSAALVAGGTLSVAPAATVVAGADADLAAGGGLTLGGSVAAGGTARLAAGGALAVAGGVAAGLDAVLAAGGDLTVPGTVTAGRSALLGTDGTATIAGSIAVAAGGRLIIGVGADFTLAGTLGAPGGRIMIRRAERIPGNSGTIRFEGDPNQLAPAGEPELIVVDSSGDLRPLGAPDPGTDVGQLLGTLNALRAQTPEQISFNRIVRLDGFPSFVGLVTGIQTEFARPGDEAQSTVEVDLGRINAPGSLVYVFGENGQVRSAPTAEALRLRAVGVYVNATAPVTLFGVINGVAGDNASTYVQRLGDPQFRQLINECAIGTIGCTFLPLPQSPAIYVPPVVVLEGGPPRLDESSVPIVNTGPEDSLRLSATEAEGGAEDEDEQERAELPKPGTAGRSGG
jgi:filamentous hemagglutinin family protein